MKRFVGTVTFVLGLGAAVTLGDTDPLKFSAVLLETAPLMPFGAPPFTYEASLVNVGPNLAIGTILFCDSATGQCSSPPLGCPGTLLAPGEGCSARVGSMDTAWVRLLLIRFGDKKPVDARGSLQVRPSAGHSLVSEALPRAGTPLVTEAP